MTSQDLKTCQKPDSPPASPHSGPGSAPLAAIALTINLKTDVTAPHTLEGARQSFVFVLAKDNNNFNREFLTVSAATCSGLPITSSYSVSSRCLCSFRKYMTRYKYSPEHK